jgi:hypothetical protein
VTPKPEYSERYYDLLARLFGEERAAWSRLPREERERELRWYYEHLETPDDVSEVPPELDGGVRNP